MRERWRQRVVVAAVLAGGCVYPVDSPTGIEFSWQFFEHEPSDGEAAQRVRTCVGVGVETLAAAIRDADDETRAGTFRFACEDGFQTASDLARSASEAFLELHPGDYEVAVAAEVVDAPDEPLAERTVDVLERAVTLELWEFTMAPVEWTLQLQGADGCAGLALGLYYADPGSALADAPVGDDGEAIDVLYREGLTSDRGLAVGGELVPCAGLDGTHVFTGVDRGAYRLEVTADESSCAFEVELDRGTTTSIDLAALPCGA